MGPYIIIPVSQVWEYICETKRRILEHKPTCRQWGFLAANIDKAISVELGFCLEDGTCDPFIVVYRGVSEEVERAKITQENCAQTAQRLYDRYIKEVSE